MKISNSRKAAIFCELYRFGDEILKELCIQDGVVRDTHQELAYEDISNLTCDEILENYLADCMVQVRSMFRSGFNGWDPVAGFISDKDLNTVFAIVYRQYLLHAHMDSSIVPEWLIKPAKNKNSNIRLESMNLGVNTF